MPSSDRTLAPASPEEVGLSREGLANTDAALQALIDAGELAGAVTLVARHGRLVHTNAMGVKSLATGEALAADTIFRIFSMTKPVTAVAMVILYDQGLWRPEDPIARHLPALADLKLADGSAPGRQPTMLDLMTHTAGFSYGFTPDDPVDALYLQSHPLRASSMTEMAERLGALPLAYEPGSQWRYSIAMDVQGAVIEGLSGQSLPDFMRTRIFEPLGMADTGFFVPAEKQDRLPGLYEMGPEGRLREARSLLGRDHQTTPALPSGGGGLFSTAADYARFAQMLLNRGEWAGQRIVSPQAVALMTTNHLSEALLAAGHGIGVQQIRPGYGYGFNGVVIYDPAAADLPVGAGTYLWDGAAGTWFWIDPVNDLLFVGLIQRMAVAGMPLVQPMTQRLIAKALLVG
ncbi:CubicO group peptidase (beta-lactamase class C family) [Caulobacter ginsengisoli]|uniref:CubicO group peptidase (Beta-lactamase class C family) n=1 Tax=Caulobacter ginsengisoli TaxID=400775 RepID=A0ABU0IXA7_9CAUL|nr:serine hydrolase domain-containing protein [Caulobacter ginsengisoli]MDQ0466630.1 CubicO group peptidase (beta-lactamase class C family) [Caulobacter ginsengisoli]